MPTNFTKIWKRDKVTGNYYLLNLKSFLQEQNKKYQMDLIKEDYPAVFA